MTRNELYNKITPCGNMEYQNMVYLLQSVAFEDETIRQLLLNRIRQGGELNREDWIIFVKNVVFTPETTLTEDAVISWLNNKCGLNRVEFTAFLEGIEFIDGSEPTFILSEQGDILVTEN